MAEETINGVPVTDAQIGAWADEAERGYSVDDLRSRGRRVIADGPTAVVPVELDQDLLNALNANAERAHISTAEATKYHALLK